MASTGKGALSRRRKRRLSEKRARKAAEKAKYELWKSLGQNQKSKRAKLRAKQLHKVKLRKSRHAGGPCGNVGCKVCNPVPYNLLTPRLLAAE